MATQRTSRAKLEYWQLDDLAWHVQFANTCALIDAVNAVGALAVTRTETPSASLNVAVASGSFRKADGTLISYAGTSSVAVAASSTRRLWLTDAGVLASGSAFPAGDIVRLATVITGATTITSITDERLPFASFGDAAVAGAPAGATYIVQTAHAGLSAEQALSSLATGLLKVTTGTGVLSTAVAAAAYTQTYSTADRTLSAYTPDAEGTPYVGATDGEAQLADLNALRVAVENLRAFVEDLAGVVNSLVDDLQTHGLVG